MKNLKALEKKLEIKFKNREFLTRALVHRSYLNETSDSKLRSNERLEFLGDAILSFVISEWLFEIFPHYPEGQLTNFRSNLVRTSSLALISQQLEIGNHLLMSRGEKESGGAKNNSLLANSLEAVIGAIYLDQGIATTRKFIKKNFTFLVKKINQRRTLKDEKSILQEILQAKLGETPVYKTLKEVGPDHNKTFTAGVYIRGKILAKGQGKSKQIAEENAAQAALKKGKHG